MKSQVGLGRLYPDGRLDRAQDIPEEPAGDAAHESGKATPDAAGMVSVVVHVEKAALNELLQKTTQP